MESELPEILVSLIIALAGTAFSAAQGAKWWQRIVAGREERIAHYIEVGIRHAYRAFVRRRKREGVKMSEADAEKAREIALRAAGEEAIMRGDMRLLQNLSETELNSRLEGALQEIKALAAAGDAARVSDREPPYNPRGNLRGTMQTILLTIGLGSVFFAGCAGLEPAFEVLPDPIPAYEAAAREAWIEWEANGQRGTLPDFDATGLTDDQAAEVAYRYGLAVLAYSTAQIQSRQPRPSIPFTLQEASAITAWYLREAHPHVRLTWRQIQTKANNSGLDPGRLAPLLGP